MRCNRNNIITKKCKIVFFATASHLHMNNNPICQVQQN